MAIATLGPITFEVSSDKIRTWHEAQRGGESRWARHEVHLAAPKLEFLGPGNDRITLAIRLDAERGLVPSDELKAMRKERDEGNVLNFVMGEDVIGKFVIRGIEEVWTRVDARGSLVAATATLTIEGYA